MDRRLIKLIGYTAVHIPSAEILEVSPTDKISITREDCGESFSGQSGLLILIKTNNETQSS